MFTAILLIGLAWVWIHGDLEWVKKLAQLDQPANARSGPTTPRRAA
jgi:hypothetical protein